MNKLINLVILVVVLFAIVSDTSNQSSEFSTSTVDSIELPKFVTYTVTLEVVETLYILSNGDENCDMWTKTVEINSGIGYAIQEVKEIGCDYPVSKHAMNFTYVLE